MLSRRVLLLSGTVFSVCRSPLVEAAIRGSKRIVLNARPVNAFYVSPSGNDSNNGRSPQTAWQTIAKVSAGVYTAGTQILFQGGQTFTGSVTLRSGSYSTISPPTVAKPLVIGSFGNGRATINVTAPSTNCFTITNIGAFTIQNLILTGGAGTSDGVHIFNTGMTNLYSGINLINLDISGLGVGVNMEATGDNTHGFSNVNMTGLHIHNLQAAASGPGIFMSAGSFQTTNAVYCHSNVTISNCTVTGAASDGIDAWNTNGFLIQFCRITGCGTTSTSGTAGIQTQACINGTIQFCEVDRQILAAGATFDSGGIDIDQGSQNVTVQYCWVHDNAGAGVALFQGHTGTITYANVTIRYNITQNNGTAGTGTNVPCEIILGSAPQLVMTGIAVYNNTFYASKGASNVNSIVLFGAANITGNVANNIFYGTPNPLSINAASLNPSTVNFTRNDYFGTTKIQWNGSSYATVALWQTATGQEKIGGVDVSLTSDPRLTSPGRGGTTNGYDPRSLTAYHLQHGSPMIGAGLSLAAQFSISPGPWDYYGDPIPNRRAWTGYNIGADGANR